MPRAVEMVLRVTWTGCPIFHGSHHHIRLPGPLQILWPNRHPHHSGACRRGVVGIQRDKWSFAPPDRSQSLAATEQWTIVTYTARNEAVSSSERRFSTPGRPVSIRPRAPSASDLLLRLGGGLGKLAEDGADPLSARRRLLRNDLYGLRSPERTLFMPPNHAADTAVETPPRRAGQIGIDGCTGKSIRREEERPGGQARAGRRNRPQTARHVTMPNVRVRPRADARESERLADGRGRRGSWIR